jgi:hypothetical protein
LTQIWSQVCKPKLVVQTCDDSVENVNLVWKPLGGIRGCKFGMLIWLIKSKNQVTNNSGLNTFTSSWNLRWKAYQMSTLKETLV